MMTDRQIVIIKNSWSAVMVQSQEAGELFYQKLFEEAPSLHTLFRNDIELQARKFTSMMTLLIRSIQYSDKVAYELEELAKRHIRYGARPEHYVIVGDSLLWMMKQRLEDRWDIETEQAWKDMYQLITRTMMSAYNT